MARKLGPTAVAILDALRSEGPLAVRELVQCIGQPARTVERTCSRLKASGTLQVACVRQFPRARKRLAVYAPADATPSTVGFVDLLQAWR